MTTSEPEHNVRELYELLLDLDPAEQERRLAASEASPAVVQEVRELLAWTQKGQSGDVFAETRLGAVGADLVAAAAPSDGLLGTWIGGYELLEALGSGGMGTVYLARQEEPVRREVALKLIKRGMDSDSMVARFERERQSLALMDHDGIARVFDFGTTDTGQPYYVMERVDGEPLDEFAATHRLSLDDRLAVLGKVCAAVHHAHQKGIVHRDLKPSNVLVRMVDGEPQVKVIDFGLAKAVRGASGGLSMQTEPGAVVGTPEFMAPELADPANLDVDTRVDVFSVGVMLYQLLVGELPFGREELWRGGVGGLAHNLQALETPRPSSRIRTAQSSETAVSTRTSMHALRRALRSDLDWVVLKAMEKNRERRYRSVAALADDLQRFRDHLPLEAGPPSAVYRIVKFTRRHRGRLVAAGLIVASLIGGGIATLTQYLRADAMVQQFDQLKGVVVHERTIQEEQTLFPAWPESLPDMQAWLGGRVATLLAMRPTIEAAIRAIEVEALPWTEEQQQQDLVTHPDYVEWVRQKAALQSQRYAHAIRRGEAKLELPVLTPKERDLEISLLLRAVRTRVSLEKGKRINYGQEAFGLACAKRLLERVEAGPEPVSKCTAQQMLAYASLANGQDQEAVAAAKLAVRFGGPPGRHRDGHVRDLGRIEKMVRDAEKLLAAAETSFAQLDVAVHQRRTWRLEDADGSRTFLHATLREVLQGIKRVESELIPRVQRRISWAKSIAEFGTKHPKARYGYADVAGLLASSDAYKGQTIELSAENLVGLVPLGKNPVTGLLEFYHLRSAWDGATDPAALPIPEIQANGDVAMNGDTGIVFVLIPGGSYWMGSQRKDPQKPNYDPMAARGAPPSQIILEPFFMARHELTKGQWKRMWAGDAALADPGQAKVGSRASTRPITWANPVESVTWSQCQRLLREHGLVLPTEAQWEYACRAGTTTPFWCRPAELVDCANLADLSSQGYANWNRERWNDKHFIHAPVGSFRANPWGLYDVHGNVFEWARDHFGEYQTAVRMVDGLRVKGPTEKVAKVIRGGSYMVPGWQARSATRASHAGDTAMMVLGCRPSRQLDPRRKVSAEDPSYDFDRSRR